MRDIELIVIIIMQVIWMNGAKGDLDRNFNQLQAIADGCLKGGE